MEILVLLNGVEALSCLKFSFSLLALLIGLGSLVLNPPDVSDLHCKY